MSIKIDDYLKRIKLHSELATSDIDIEKAKEGYQKYLSDSSKKEKNIFEKATDSVAEWGRNVFGDLLFGKDKGNFFSKSLSNEAERNNNPDRPNSLWSEEQKNIFGYKYLSNPEEAYRYAIKVNNNITQKSNELLSEEIGKDASSNFGNAALHTVNSIITAPLSLVEYVDKVGDTAKYGTPIASPLHASPTLMSEAAQSGISSKLNEYGTIDENVPVFGGKGWGDVYGLGTSIAQSAYSGVLGGGSVLGSSYTLATYFGQSATRGIDDALSRGANGKQALAYGTAAGLAEAIPEMISVKSLIGISKAEGVQNIFKAVLKQAGEEATEEFTTSVLTEVADRWIMGGKSQYALTVQELMASGLSQEEAENKAFTMTLENIAFDVISGAASGGISGAGAAGVNNINQRYFQGEKNARAKTELTPKQNELIAEGKKYKQTAKRSASLERKLAKGKELSGYDLRMLASEVANTQRASDIEVLRKAIIDRMKSEGVSDSQAKRLGEIALKKALGNEKLSALEEGMLKRNSTALKVYNQMDADNMASGLSDSDWVEDTPLQKLRNESAEINDEGLAISRETTNMTGESQAIKPSLKARNAQEYKINPESPEGKFAEPEGKITYEKTSENSRIHTEGISTSLTKEEIGEISALEDLANTLGVDIHIYETKLQKDGSRSYTDKDGNVITGSGYYDPNNRSVHIDLRAGNNGEGAMLYTASHELVHFMKDISEEHFNNLEKLVTEALIQGGGSIEKLIDNQRRIALANGRNLTEAQLREEMVADACESFLASNTAVDRIKALKTENRSFWNALKRFFTSLFNKINSIYKTVAPDSYEGKYIANMRNGAKRIRDAFMEGVAAAGEKYSSERKALGEGANVKVNTEGEFVQGTTKDKKTVMTNARTWKSGGRATLKATLESEGFSADDVKAALTIMDEHMKLVEQFGTKYTAQDIANNAVLTTDVKTGEAVLSAIISNGDYPVNIDLLTICKKREAYQQVINRLCESGMINKATLDSLAIAEINKILGKYGFETACLGCYVESRRIRIQEWAETIVKEWNGIVDKIVGKGKGEYLNASSDTFVADLSNDDISKLSSELEAAYERDGLKYGRATVVKKMEQLQREVPSMRKYLTVSDLITPEGRANIKAWSQELNSLINCRYGTNTPKIIQKFNPYNSELARYGIVPRAYNSLRDYLYAIGGARMQSFSDFIIENWFDYAQIVADLSARKLPMHTYTKEASLVKLFGMTGIKINMSLIPDVDSSLGKEYAGLTKNKNGEYELIFADKDRHKATGGKSYMQSFNFADAIALQNDPNYSANIGTIAIGISDKQIEMMLDDSRIRMVIPYHSSGMNPIFAHLVGIKNYNDYTNDQSTGVKRIVDSNGNERSVKLTKEQQAKLTRGFEYNEALQRLGDARKAAEEYKDWCRDTSKHSIEIDGKTYYAELTPKFEKFSERENYYKLLTDYNAYDCITEESKPQQDVTQTYPENFADMLGDELKSRDIYAKKQDAKWDDAMAEINAYLESHTRADTVAYADEHGIKISAKDRKLAKQESAKKEIRHKARSVDTNGNELTEAQISYFKDSKIRDSKGNLKVLYHGTTADFNTFKKGDVGFHFGTKGAARGRVGYGKNVTIKEVYLNITNPIVFDDDLGSWDADYRLTQELYEKGILTREDAESVLFTDDRQYRRTTEKANKKLAEVLLSKGYDGIEYTNTHESKKDSTSYIIFDSKQAKLITNANPTESKDIRYKARGKVDSYTEYDKPITAEDTAILRTIGGKSVNEFTTTDIEKAQKWAYKFYKELGTKSPFFRAWFGDWRAFDQDTTKVIDATRSTGKNPRGKFRNIDTGWEINSSSVGYDETVSHSGKNKKSIIAMQNIDKIIENAILLDTEVSEYGRGKKSVYTAFMHKFYALCRINGKLYIAKMAVDESYAPGKDNTNKKFYHVRAIEIETASSVGIGESHTPIIEDTVSDISIADLFNFVKQYDDKFIPNAVDPLLLNEDGTPKVFYHGTNAEFFVFDADRTSRTTKRYAEGFYFTEERRVAEKWSRYREKEKGGEANVMAVYLDVKNPLVMSDKDYKRLGFDDKHRDKVLQSLIENKNDGIIIHPETERIPGIFEDSYKYEIDASVYTNAEKYGITDKDYAWWLEHSVSNPDFTAMQVAVFNSEQVKSATDNIGTFNKGSTDIRYKARSTVTSGQYAQMKANLSHGKVYSKASAMALVSKLAPGIRNRSFEDLSNKLWEGLNTYTSLEDKAAFASDMSEMFIDRMMVDTLTPNPEWDEASEKLSYLKPAITSINFTDAERTEIRHILDKDGLSRILGRWGYKSSGANTKRRYDLDVFITDISREMPGMEHLADMHPVDALMEIDKLYSDLSEIIKQKYESAYKDFSDEEINEIKRSIATDIMKAYQELGEQTKISKYLEEKLEYYQSRVDYWKAENAKTKAIARWNGILSTKALHIRELKKGAFYNATQYHQDLFKDSIEQLAKIQWRGNISPVSIRKVFADLKSWYSKENPMLYKDGESDNLYSDTIAAYIEKISDTEKGAFDENTYAMVYDVMNHLYTMMRNYNKVFRAGRWEDAPTLVDSYLKIMEETKHKRNAVTRLKEGYVTEFLEPMAIARRADGYNPDGFFTQIMQDLRRASIDAAVGEMNLRKDYDAFIDKNKKYLANAAKDTVNYRGFDIPKLHLIGLYMTMKRKHARAGLALNGFEYAVKNKWWDSKDYVKVPGYVPLGDNVTQKMIDDATDEQMRVIESSLTDTDKEYIRILEKLFNEDLKALKIKRDMERQGYTNATLDYYYPIIRGAIAENVDTAKISDQNRATNASFNKNTVKGAKQRLVIISADSMVNRHITDMCKYYYMSQAIENYNVLYNCDTSGNANNPINIASFVKTSKIWEKDVAYFKKIVADMQGIVDPQTAFERFIEGARGSYAKFALGANLKVLFTQFSSMIAAGDIIGYKNILSLKSLKISTSDVDKYCPLAAVRNYDKTILKAMSLTDKFGKISEAFTLGISKVDRFVIARLFASCQLEAQKKGLGELGTEENKIAAGKLLEKVIIETQQNSFATERSQAMRSRNELLKAITMFTADGMKIVSRMYDAFGELSVAKQSKDKAKTKAAQKKVARSVAVAASIAVYMSGIAVLFNWIYDRDDEEDENALLSFTLDTVGNFLGALPFISDFYDYCVNGFEVESVAFDTLNNIFGSINNISKDLVSIVSGDGERSIQDINRDLRTMLYGVGQATGLPFRNMYNLARGIIGNFSSSAGYKLDSKFYETSLAGDLEKAIENGDNSKISYMMALIYDERVNKSVSESQIDEIVRLLKSEYESNPNDYNLSQKVLPKDLPDEIKRDGVEYVLTAEQKDVFSEVYSGVTDKIDNLISSTFYLSGDDERKSYLIDYYHDKYYDMAVNEALNLEDTKKTVYDLVGFEKYAEFAYSIKDIESDKDKNGNTVSGSKKKKVIEKINSLGISSEKKLLLIAYSGYKLDSEADKAKLLRYLNRSTMTVEEKKALAKKLKLQYKNGKFY